MTAFGETVANGRTLRARVAGAMVSPSLYPTVFAVAGSTAFVLVRLPVGDLWAARARQSAAANGVGLTYWFSWFGGGSTPGTYSVLTPIVSALLGAAVLGWVATVAITPLCWRLVRGSRCPLAATWIATLTAGLSLWSGRIPFALGTAISIAALIAVRDQRRALAVICTVGAVLASPVSGAFIALGLTGSLLFARSHRAISAITILTAAISLGVVAAVFGTPGPEGISPDQALAMALALGLLLLARPPKYVAVVIVVSLAACPLLLAVPNGLGSNFQRFVWICLPVAVTATTGRRLPAAVIASMLAVGSGALATMHDVAIALAPMSSQAYYAPLAHELDAIAALATYRLEPIPDGTHTSAYALLGHAMLARGYETQTDNTLNKVLMSPATLNAVTFKIWLDNNAVGYLAVPKRSLHPNAEYNLVAAGHLGYLKPTWVGSDWTLYRVTNPTPIVPPWAKILDADQSNMIIDIDRSGTLPIRVRWSKFLTVDGPGETPAPDLDNDGHGWTVLTAPSPGRYVLHG
jgi:hypothetical protein